MRAKVYKFGPFELDPSQQRLRRRGLNFRVPASRIRLLSLFVTRRGDLITREEIAACLWKDAQTIDVASGINTALNQLRAQLGDDPGSPKYIETVVGAGYRFIASVAEVEAPLKPPGGVPDDLGPAKPEEVSLPLPEVPVSEGKPRNHRRAAALAAAAAFLIGAPVAFFLQASSHRATRPASLHLARVTDSGDVEFADISPDGKYVAYVRQIAGQRTLWLKQLTTERVLKLAAIGSFECPGLTFSPDGNYVYFVRKKPLEPSGQLFQLPLLGGDPTRVLEGISGAPAISPDGLKIAFVRSSLETHGEDSIVTAAIDGGRERVLATYKAPGIHFNLITWTADGRSLAFPLQTRLMTIPAEGGAAQPLAGQDWKAIDDLWQLPHSRDLIVVGRLADSTSSQIFEVSMAKGSIRQITRDLSNYKQARITADGKSLLAVQDVVLSTIQVLNPSAGSALRSLSAQNQSHDGVTGLAWTPQGTIVYASDPDRHRELMTMDADGSNPKVLAKADVGASVISDPAVSPHGEFIAVALWSAGDGANIWRMNMSGGSQMRLSAGIQDFPPSVTPDGKWVVYGSVQGKGSVLMKVPSAGGPATSLTDYNADNPSVSPDGKWVACFRVPDVKQPATLAIVPIAGGPPAKVFQLPETATHTPLGWMPDGRAVSFVNDVDGVGNIWQQPLDGGPATAITNFTSDKIFYFRWANDGRLALSRGTRTVDTVLIREFQ